MAATSFLARARKLARRLVRVLVHARHSSRPGAGRKPVNPEGRTVTIPASVRGSLIALWDETCRKARLESFRSDYRGDPAKLPVRSRNRGNRTQPALCRSRWQFIRLLRRHGAVRHPRVREMAKNKPHLCTMQVGQSGDTHIA